MEQVHWKKRVSGWDRRNTHGTKRDVDIIEFQMKWNTRRCAPLKISKTTWARVRVRAYFQRFDVASPDFHLESEQKNTQVGHWRHWRVDPSGLFSPCTKKKKKTPLRPVFRWSGSKNKRHMRVL